MELFSAEALLLAVSDLGDYDRIVTFLTRQWGKKRGVARGARRKHSRFGGQLQPLAKAKVDWLEKEGRELARVRSVELERAAGGLQKDLEGLMLTAYLADHVSEFAQENEPSERLFRLLDTTVEALLAGVDRGLATRYFETWVLRLGGVFPPPSECPRCGGDLESGAAVAAEADGVICGRCGGPSARQVSAPALDLLRRMGRENLPTLARRPPQAAAVEEVAEICTRVRRSFLQHELRSYDVIRETLGHV